MVLWISALVLALSAFLLFSLELMVGRALLPCFGSVQSVWLTCLMFFQLSLFAGYLYSHLITFTEKRRIIHGALVGVALFALPHLDSITIERAASNNAPIVGVLLALVTTIGIPFFFLTTCAPLVQRVYAERFQSSPYALYAASNIGSLIGLLSYPLLMEPLMRLSQQVVWWNRAFVVLAVGVVTMIILGPPVERAGEPDTQPITTRLKFQWLLLSAIPSSLLMGTTTYLTTDIASFPLLWVLPLSLYLITFIIAFGRQNTDLTPVTNRALRFLATATITMLVMGVNQPAAVLIILSLALLFFAGLVCHTRLVALQPPEAEVTTFYLYLAAGGALGGIVNAVLAPILFTEILEYPLVVLLCVFATQRRASQNWSYELKPALPVVVVIFLVLPLSRFLLLDPAISYVAMRIGVAVVAIMSYRLQNRGVAFPIALSAFFLIGNFVLNPAHRQLVDKHRDFYGVLRVHDTSEGFRILVNGRIVHGREDQARRGSCEPDGYYCRRSPLAQIMAHMQTLAAPRVIALIGVGAGNSICYASQDERWDLYELSPAVDRFARKYFTYLETNHAGRQRTFLGDGRLELLKSHESYALIVVDGFSSDSIPIHLLTKEAVRGYLEHLTPDGLVAFHITNQYFQLARPLANVAASVGLHAYTQEVQLTEDCLPSRWVYLSRSPLTLPEWGPLVGNSDQAWSDERSYLLSSIKW